MEVPSRPPGHFGSSSRKNGGKPFLWFGLTIVTLMAGIVFFPHLALAQTPSTPPAPPVAPSAGTSAGYVTVYGEVGRQGKYDIVPGETIGKVILRAGGFSTRAKDKAVKVVRKVPGKGNVTLVVNVRDVLSGKAPGKDIPLSPNDTVIVEEKLINF